MERNSEASGDSAGDSSALLLVLGPALPFPFVFGDSISTSDESPTYVTGVGCFFARAGRSERVLVSRQPRTNRVRTGRLLFPLGRLNYSPSRLLAPGLPLRAPGARPYRRTLTHDPLPCAFRALDCVSYQLRVGWVVVLCVCAHPLLDGSVMRQMSPCTCTLRPPVPATSTDAPPEGDDRVVSDGPGTSREACASVQDRVASTAAVT
jgi:hypothetical protein